ncbi:hypothetical protein CEQ90_06420 [Lewinellaceae bacterium SD302]|nr:hypothetical protein CEQ90_06420 [Lewinellaceae bacterium SD302]
MLDDETLMRAVQAGQADRLAELFRRYRQPVFTFLVRRLHGNRATAEDILQDTFERVLRYRASFKPEQSFKVWVFTIARNSLNDHCKRAGKLPISEEVVINDLPLITSSAQKDWEKREELEQGQAALATLNPAYREVLDLAWKRKLKYREIATILGTTEGNVKVKMHRACQQLQKNYQKIAR